MLEIDKEQDVEERLRASTIECAAMNRCEMMVNFASGRILVEEAEVIRDSGLLLGVSTGICLDTLQNGVQHVDTGRMLTNFFFDEAFKTFFGSLSLCYASAVAINIKRKLCTHHRREQVPRVSARLLQCLLTMRKLWMSKAGKFSRIMQMTSVAMKSTNASSACSPSLVDFLVFIVGSDMVGAMMHGGGCLVESVDG